MEVSDAELAACVATLQKLHDDDGHNLFKSSPRFKPLRTALIPLIEDLRAKFFHGNSVDGNNSRQERKRAKKMERARKKALDQQYVNNTQLRAERLARLAALQTQNPLLANVPDGVATDEPMLLKENGEEKEEDETELLHYNRSCYTCKVKFRKLHHFYDR
ncbi:Oxidoreductase, partial [Phytophthora megakarya]